MKSFSPKFYFTALVFLLALVILSAYLIRSIYINQQDLISVQENRYNSYLVTTQLRRSSDELTRLVRTYAATGNRMFEKQFSEVLAIRNGQSPLPAHYNRVYWDFLAIENGMQPYPPGDPVSLKNLMKNAGFTEEELLLLTKSQENSDDLVNLEKIAINAMKGQYQDDNGQFSISGMPDQQMAIDILHGNKYHNAKISIMAPINQFYEKLDQRTKKQVDSSANQLDFTLKLQMFIFALTVGAIFLLMVSTKRYHKKMVRRLNQLVDERTNELQKALKEVKTLRGIIPICSYCHSIRDSEETWHKLEEYLSNNSDARFSHSICPKCVPKARLEAGVNINP